MNSFGFIIHPIDPKRDVAKKFPFLARVLNERWIHFFSAFFPPLKLSRVRGVRSLATGEEIEGWFVACPYTPVRMMQLPTRTVYRKIIATAKLAERLGANLVGLGAFTSVVGDAGVTISRQLNVPVTTGDSYTVAVAVETLVTAGRRMGIEPTRATAAIVGASGAIGSASARLLADEVANLILVGRTAHRVQALAADLSGMAARVVPTTELETISQADLVLASSSAPQALIGPSHLGAGTVVCDVARPRDVARQVIDQRDDVLVIDGGIVQVPGEVDYGFDFGFPSGTTYACMAETMALVLEGRMESYTLGKQIRLAQVREIKDIAERHGFHLAGFRSFDRPLSEADLERTRARIQAVRRVRRGRT